VPQLTAILRIAGAVLLSGIASTFADWFFGGVLFHSKYLAHPEIWRNAAGGNEGRAVAWAVLFDFVTCGAFVGTCLMFAVSGYAPAFRLAVAIWVMAAVPILVTNALFIKLHPLTVVSHSLGWLAKLALAAAAVGWLL